MAIDFDTGAISAALLDAIRKQAKKGWSTISGFVPTQTKMMAQQAAWIAYSSAHADLKDDPELRRMFSDQLAESVRGLAKSVAAMTILTVEQVWNSVVKILWGAINKALSGATGGLLTLPTL